MTIYDYSGNELFSTTPELSVPWFSDMHKGYSSPTVAPNTLAAFYRAFLNGADWVEVDARLASDGVYVVYHDAEIVQNGVRYIISEETSSTLTSLVLSVDDEYGECKIPTLKSVLDLCAYTGLCCNLDCKSINATTLAQMVVDCGMSGRVMYANTSTPNASAIMSIDSNAGFIFEYQYLSAWASVITDNQVKLKSYVWDTVISEEAMKSVRRQGFKYLLAGVSDIELMAYKPDCIEFETTADCKSLNDEYLASLVLA